MALERTFARQLPVSEDRHESVVESLVEGRRNGERVRPSAAGQSAAVDGPVRPVRDAKSRRGARTAAVHSGVERFTNEQSEGGSRFRSPVDQIALWSLR